MTRVQYRLLFTVLVVAWTAAPARAQWVATPYLGLNVAGDAEFRRGGPGGSIGYFRGGLGFEFDVMRYNHFFKDSEIVPRDPAAPPNCTGDVRGPCADINTDAVGFMGNVVVPIRFQAVTKWRPYGTTGLGVIRAWTNEEGRQQNNLGFNVGGGVMYSANGRVSLRGDLRYTQALVDEDKREGILLRDYGFWRTTIGVTFGFPR